MAAIVVSISLLFNYLEFLPSIFNIA